MDDYPTTGLPSTQPEFRILQATTFDFSLIFSEAIKLMGVGFRQFLTILLFVHLPISIVQMFVIPRNQELSQDPALLLNQAFSLAFFALLTVFVTVNIYTAARYQIVGEPKPFHTIFLNSIIKYPITVIAAVVFAVVVMAGGLAFIIPGIIFFIYGSVFMPVIVLRDRGVLRSLIESYELVKGNWWRVFLVELVVLIAICFLAIPVIIFILLVEPGVMLELFIELFFGALAIISRLVTLMTFLNLESIRKNQRYTIQGS